jgi:caffeoyl-CoA O-methyltransferase
MTELISRAAERFAEDHTTPPTGQLAEIAAWTREHTAWPAMMSGTAEARLLEALIVVGGARNVLEIGTFTGFGALLIAAAMPSGGRVTTLEVDPEMAETARRHFAASPVGDRVELVLGDALDSLAALDGPFDLVWIDARKSDYPAYYDAVLPKLAPRGIIVADNLFRAGAVLAGSDGEADEGTRAMREFARRVQEDERVDNALLTIGDGVMLAWRRPGEG